MERGATGVEDAPPRDAGDRFRVLLVAAEEHVGPALRRELDEHAAGRRLDLRIVAPLLAKTAFEQISGAADDRARDRTSERLGHSLDEAKAELSHHPGYEDAAVRGRLGDSDPILAIEDALREYPADEVVLVTHDREHSLWLEGDMFERADERIDPPIHHYVCEDGKAILIESAGPGIASDPDGTAADRTLPELSPRDVAGIVFAIAGTLVLFVIAGANPDETEAGLDVNAIIMLIAGAFALINIAHVVGLVLFESVRYRGTVQRAFANLSLFGTAAAIVVCLLLTLV